MKISFVFFGTPEFSVMILEELKKGGFIPSLIVTQEDKPQGRHLAITPPPVKVWAEKNNIPFIQPKSLKDPEVIFKLRAISYKLFIVASYGKIIPENILEIPECQTLNVHPSLLPKLRGPSPIQGAILNEDKTGVTIMRLDEEMDHGPIVIRKETETPEWPMYMEDLEKLLAHEGGVLLRGVISDWVQGKIAETPQDHSKATYCKKIEKKNGQINLEDNPEKNLRKIRAFSGWPNAYTELDTKNGPMRIVIKKARIENGELVLERVIPAGKKEMSFDDFKRGFISN